MKYIRKSLIITLPVLIALFLWKCDDSKISYGFTEGIIEYDVSFPYNSDDILINIYPSEMIVHFKDNRMHSSLESLGGLVATELVTDNNTRELSQYMRTFRNKFGMHLSEKEVRQMSKEYPRMRLEETEEVDTLAGYLCKKTIAYFESDSMPPAVLWHTNEIKIKNPNWFNQYKECPEFLLGYEIEQYGMRMKLVARSVVPAEVPEELFASKTDYDMVDYPEMVDRIEGLIKQFQSGDQADTSENEESATDP